MANQITTALNSVMEFYIDQEVGYTCIPSTLPEPIRQLIFACASAQPGLEVDVDMDGSFTIHAA